MDGAVAGACLRACAADKRWAEAEAGGMIDLYLNYKSILVYLWINASWSCRFRNVARQMEAEPCDGLCWRRGRDDAGGGSQGTSLPLTSAPAQGSSGEGSNSGTAQAKSGSSSTQRGLSRSQALKPLRPREAVRSADRSAPQPIDTRKKKSLGERIKSTVSGRQFSVTAFIPGTGGTFLQEVAPHSATSYEPLGRRDALLR